MFSLVLYMLANEKRGRLSPETCWAHLMFLINKHYIGITKPHTQDKSSKKCIFVAVCVSAAPLLAEEGDN